MLNEIKPMAKMLKIEKLLLGLVLLIILMISNSLVEQASALVNNITGVVTANIKVGDWMMISLNFTFGSI